MQKTEKNNHRKNEPKTNRKRTENSDNVFSNSHILERSKNFCAFQSSEWSMIIIDHSLQKSEKKKEKNWEKHKKQNSGTSSIIVLLRRTNKFAYIYLLLFRISRKVVRDIEIFVDTFFLGNKISNNFCWKLFFTKLIVFEIFAKSLFFSYIQH